MSKSRVEACIKSVLASHPGISALAQSRYFEAVHQELAPLARQLENELALARAELNQRDDQERDLTRHLKQALVASQERVKALEEIKSTLDLLSTSDEAFINQQKQRIKALEDALRPFSFGDQNLISDHDLARAAELLEGK